MTDAYRCEMNSRSFFIEKGAMSYWLSVRVSYRKPTTGVDSHAKDAFLHTGKRLLNKIPKVEEELAKLADIVRQRNSNYNRLSSSFTLVNVYETELTVIDYPPLKSLNNEMRFSPPHLQHSTLCNDLLHPMSRHPSTIFPALRTLCFRLCITSSVSDKSSPCSYP